MTETAILEFREACLQADVDAAPCRDVSLVLGAGEAVLVSTEVRGGGTPLCDAAQGLLTPIRGEVMFAGRSWEESPPARVSVLRAKIGRVFCDPSWVSNLNVYDNIVLATRHHTRTREPAIRVSVERLAKVCGLQGIPAGRANTVPSGMLQRLQWVRAFLGQPELVLLEEPMAGVPPEAMERLKEVIRHARSEGTAVVWVTSAPGGGAILSFTERYALRDGTLSPDGSDIG